MMKKIGMLLMLMGAACAHTAETAKAVRETDTKSGLTAIKATVKPGAGWNPAPASEQPDLIDIYYAMRMDARQLRKSRNEELRDAHTFTVCARVKPGSAAKGQVQLALEHRESKAKKHILLSVEGTATGIVREWNATRGLRWQQHAKLAPSSCIARWVNMVSDRPAHHRDRDMGVSLFNILGGRAAIEETLQLNAIGSTKAMADLSSTIPIGQIKTVVVKSHPFEDMLAGKQGGTLAIANLVPNDRFFVYMSQPEHLVDSLEHGVPFAFQSATVARSACLSYHLKQRYLDRLAISDKWGKLFLKSKAVSEIAAFCPDLFFIDGTDLTIIMKIRDMKNTLPLLAMININVKPNGAIFQKQGHNGHTSYWAIRDKYLMLSSNPLELRKTLRLQKSNGEGSLGKSAEFRYMLTKLPIQEATRGYAYFSDPFIRRLVGPEVKIGQMRRLLAKDRMEQLTAAALLHKLDGFETNTQANLAKHGYIDAASEDLKLLPDYRCESKTYGPATRLKTILELRVRKSTEMEAEAYGHYVRNYNRYWSEYFDPIAVRLDKKGSEFELETFILPLLDSEMYNFVRTFFSRSSAPLEVPTLEPEPVMTLSGRVNERYWQEANRNGRELTRLLGLSPDIFKYLGPTVHFAVMDGDPIISLGSGDVMGAFGNLNGLGRSEMIALPVALSVLTRPCRLLVELRDPEQVIRHLNRAYPRRQGGYIKFDVNYARIKGKNKWHCTISAEAVVKLRFGLEVQGKYLIISNLPWLKTRIAGASKSQLANAALGLSPGAGTQQLAGLHAAAVDRQRTASFVSQAHLLPLIKALGKSPAEAQHLHWQIFGFEPRQPSGQLSMKDGELWSTEYGNPRSQLQPEFTEGNREFGVFSKIQQLMLSMQFEDAGLRSRIRWTTRAE